MRSQNPTGHYQVWQSLGTASSESQWLHPRAELAWTWNQTIEEGRVCGTGSDSLPLLSNNPDITSTNTKIPFLRGARKRTKALDSDSVGVNPGPAVYSRCELFNSPCLISWTAKWVEQPNQYDRAFAKLVWVNTPKEPREDKCSIKCELLLSASRVGGYSLWSFSFMPCANESLLI